MPIPIRSSLKHLCSIYKLIELKTWYAVLALKVKITHAAAIACTAKYSYLTNL